MSSLYDNCNGFCMFFDIALEPVLHFSRVCDHHGVLAAAAYGPDLRMVSRAANYDLPSRRRGLGHEAMYARHVGTCGVRYLRPGVAQGVLHGP